jgi:HTH-type transcriptional regulator/antitoxin HigA
MATEIKPIRTEKDHKAALKEIERLWDAKLGTPDGDRLEVLATLVHAYEEKHHPMDPPDAIEAITFRLEALGLTKQALVAIIGGSGRVSEVMTRKRNLSVGMMRRLRDELKIPPEILLNPTRTKGTSRRETRAAASKARR